MEWKEKGRPGGGERVKEEGRKMGSEREENRKGKEREKGIIKVRKWEDGEAKLE